MNSSGFPFSCFLWLLSRSLSNLHLLWAFIIHGGQKSVVFGGRKSFTWTLALLLSPMVWNHLWWFFLLAPFCPPLCLEPDLQKPSSRLPCSWAASWVCPLRGMRWSLKKKRTTMVGIVSPCSLPAVLVVAMFLSLTAPVRVVISFSLVRVFVGFR